MPKKDKGKFNLKERVEDNLCDLSLSELSDVPVSQIASFKRVTVLDLSSNRLTTLKDNFVTLSRIVKLDLSKNQLTELPEDFGLLYNLRHLDLYDNQLEHLPLSFGYLTNLRYLDLKGNPLLPALAKIVGFCSTAKECHDSARNTVQFMASMQIEAEKAQEMYYDQNKYQQQKGQETDIELEILKTEADQQQQRPNIEQNLQQNQNTMQQKPKKSTKTKQNNKTKNRHPSSHHQQQQLNTNHKAIQTNPDDLRNDQRSKKNSQTKDKKQKQSTALSSILIFFFLLTFNIFIIYLVMFKNPEISEFIVNFIPQQYRNWFIEKTEIFRLRVTDWIMDFITPPEEH